MPPDGLPDAMVERASVALDEHETSVEEYGPDDELLGWSCTCGAGRFRQGAIADAERCLDEARIHTMRAVLAAALEGWFLVGWMTSR